MSKSQDWQRARSAEQKEVRREAILTAAGELLDEGGLEAAGLNAIARRSEISKANIYRYFETREAVLLHLFVDELDAWIAELGNGLKKHRGQDEVAPVARVYASTMAPRRRLCELMSSLSTVLERNVSEEAVVAFKRKIQQSIAPMLEGLCDALPRLQPEQAFEFGRWFILAASGAWPHCHPGPVMDRVLERPEFVGMRLEFEPGLESLAATLLHGLLNDPE